MLRQGAIAGILAVGLAHVLIIGGIDLAIGAMISLTSVLDGFLMVTHNWPVWLASLLCVALITAVGFTAGSIIHFTCMSPLIAILGVMNVLQGMAYLANNGMPIHNIPDVLRALGQQSTFVTGDEQGIGK